MTDPLEFTWVVDDAGMSRLGAQLRRARRHALDSESNSGFVYRETLCLMQLNVQDELWLIDLLAFDDPAKAMEPLRDVFEDPAHTTYLHGGEFDVACIKRDLEIALAGVWDSQQAASYLGWERTGYGAVVERVCGVHLRKAYAHYDWSRRPIAEGPLQYALHDVRYLPRVCERLRREVKAADLEEEVAIANRVVEEATWNAASGAAQLWRIKGVRQLPSDALPVLVALLEWRERTGEARDLPPGRVLNNRALLALSHNLGANLEDLRRSGLRGRRLNQFGAELLEVIGGARREPPAVPPLPPRPPRNPLAEARRERLRNWRRTEARRRKLPERAVLPRAALEHLQRHGAGDLESVPQLGAKRIELYGDELVRLCTPT